MTKKIMVLLLAAAITTGIGGFGTYAYLTDRDTLADDINITMGSVDVEAYWATDGDLTNWVATSGATEALRDGSGLNFKNVKPGDTFEREVVIANYGTLKADITIEISGEIGKLLNVKLVNVTSQNGNFAQEENNGRWYENGVNPNGGFIRATVQVTVPEDAGNEWMSKLINANANQFIEANTHQTIY